MAAQAVTPHPDEHATGPAAGSPTNDGKYLYCVSDAMRLLSLSRSVIYELLRSGELRSVRVRSARRIPASALAEFVAALERQAQQEASSPAADDAWEAVR
jgi:excisionase family DNA binding protein